MNNPTATASKASKIAKIMILAFVFMVVAPMQAHAAAFISEAIDILGVVIIAIGGGLGIWGVVNLLEGYGNDNPGAKSQGIKQLMAGLGLILLGIFAIPQLETLQQTKKNNAYQNQICQFGVYP
jgi:hypothetical protein